MSLIKVSQHPMSRRRSLSIRHMRITLSQLNLRRSAVVLHVCSQDNSEEKDCTSIAALAPKVEVETGKDEGVTFQREGQAESVVDKSASICTKDLASVQKENENMEAYSAAPDVAMSNFEASRNEDIDTEEMDVELKTKSKKDEVDQIKDKVICSVTKFPA
eukprot:TRINITY_DN7670_c0_g1_i1.p1 TRINITY_DN7670_c0_g1~~TRINITY_DN7670_c0_g1_i1.p1  ORF type:complete len:161 (+),score=25.88 TRINITY_DN7670_c0_g1_i1:118-600(+)